MLDSIENENLLCDVFIANEMKMFTHSLYCDSIVDILRNAEQKNEQFLSTYYYVILFSSYSMCVCLKSHAK